MITVKDVEQLAQLARIKVPDAEKEQLAREIDSILGYVAELQSASADMSAEPQVGVVKNIMRGDDAANAAGSSTQKILAEAPDREADFIAVKKILGGGSQ